MSVLALAALLSACASTQLPPWPGQTTGQPAPAPARPGTPQQPQATTQPVAPAPSLAPLPYSAAVAARFTDPSTTYNTPGLAPSRTHFTTDSELADWLLSQANKSLGSSSRLGVVIAGQSQRGTPISALVATRGEGIQASAVQANQRPTVLLVAQQHGDDPAGAEALLVIARELAPGGLLEPLLAQINVLLVPRANPDGAQAGSRTTANGTDLAHDHLLLSTPEAQALAALTRDYRPIAVFDLQEYAAAGRFLEKFQAVQAYDARLQFSATANLHEFVNKAAREWYAAPLRSAWSQNGLSNEWHYTTSADPQDKSLSMGSATPDSLRNASGLKNAIGMLIESRGSDLGRSHIQRRVHSQVVAITSALRSTAERARELNQVQNFVARDVASMACHRQVAIQAELTPEQRTLTMVQPDTGLDQPVRVDWQSALQLKTVQSRPRSCGYWLSAQSRTAVERLRLMGLQVLRVAEPGSLLADSYQEARNNTPTDAQPGAQRTLTLMPTRGAIEAVEGSYYLSLNQPLAHLATAALEPDTPYSYFSKGLLSSLEDVARVMAPPSIVFEEEGE